MDANQTKFQIAREMERVWISRDSMISRIRVYLESLSYDCRRTISQFIRLMQMRRDLADRQCYFDSVSSWHGHDCAEARTDSPCSCALVRRDSQS